MSSAEEILAGLWRFTARHPEWDQDEDWDPEVAWWAALRPGGLVLIDPLVADWSELDRLVELAGGCAGILRTVFFHERSIAEASRRYRVEVWARRPPANVPPKPFDHAVGEEQLPGDLHAFDVLRDDEVAIWLPEQHALAFGDAMVRDPEGHLSMCPESWVKRVGGWPALRERLAPLAELEPQHVLVSHGPLVLGDGAESLPRALAETE
jgi:hypothetical protein